MRLQLFTFFSLFTASISCALTVDSVITLSDSCVQISWTPDTQNTNSSWYQQYGSNCTGADSIYLHCDFISGNEYKGIAYSYGGEDAWYTFRERLQSGYLAGSHSCQYSTYGDPSNKVTGTDCSGFLCFVWGYPRTTTTTLYNSSDFTTIPITEVQPGDALVKASASCGYHAILIVEADDPAEVVISEASSTVFGCRERIVDLTSSAWSCYKAIRYPKLVSVRHTVISHVGNAGINLHKATISNGLLVLDFITPFCGTVKAYLPDGSLLQNTTIASPLQTVQLRTNHSGTGLILLTLQQSNDQNTEIHSFITAH